MIFRWGGEKLHFIGGHEPNIPAVGSASGTKRYFAAAAEQIIITIEHSDSWPVTPKAIACQAAVSNNRRSNSTTGRPPRDRVPYDGRLPERAAGGEATVGDHLAP